MDTEAQPDTTARQRRLREELRATLASYHELGPSYEPQIVESFIERTRPLFAPGEAIFHGRPASRGARGRPPRRLLLAAVALLTWLVLAGHLFGGWHARPVAPGWYQPPAPVAPANPAPLLFSP